MIVARKIIKRYHSIKATRVLLLIFFCINTIVQPIFGNDTQKSEIIAIGNQGYPPYSFIDNKGTYSGFDVELFKAIMNEANLDYDLILLKWGNVIDRFNSGEADVIIGLIQDEACDSIYDFCTPSLFINEEILCRKDCKISRIAEIKGKNIIVYSDWTHLEPLFAPPNNNKAIEVEDLKTGIEMIASGKGDLMLCNGYLAKYYLENIGLDNLQIRHLNKYPYKYGIGVKRNRPELRAQINHGFEMVKGKGIYDELYKKWIDPSPNKPKSKDIYVTIGIAILVVIGVAIIVFILKLQIKRATRKLLRQGRQMDLAIRAGDLLVWGYDVKNDRLFNIIGWTVPDQGIPLKDVTEVIHPDDAWMFFEKMNDVLSGKPVEGSIIVRCFYPQNEEWLYIKKEFAVIKDENGNIIEVIGTHKDVTKEIEEQNKLEGLLKKYQTVFDASSVGLEIYDENGIAIDYNKAEAEILGINNIDKAELLSKRIGFYDNPHFKDAIPYVNAHKCYVGIVIYDFDTHNVNDIAICETKKEKKFVELRVTPIINSHGKLENIVCASIDVTRNILLNQELDQINKEKDLMINTMPIGLSIYNKDGYQVYMNVANAQILGIEDIQAHLKKPLFLYDNPVILDDVKEKIRKGEEADFVMLNDFDKIKELDYYKTKFSGIKYLATRFCVIKDNADNITSYMFMLRDVTESYIHQAELEKSYQKTLLAINTSNLYQWDYDCKTQTFSVLNKKGKRFSLSVENCKNYIHTEDLGEFNNLTIKMDNGSIVDFSVNMRVKIMNIESWQYITINGTPLKRNSEGKIVRYTGFQRNNTEWHELTLALKKQNELNQMILDNVSSGLVYIDVSHKVVWENVSDKFPLYHTGGFKLFEKGTYCKDTHSVAKMACDNCLIERVLNCADGARSEKTLPCGQVIEINANAIIGADGKPEGAILRVDDITRRVQLYNDLQSAKSKAEASHQLLSEILDRIPSVIFIKDVADDFRYIVANRSFCECYSMSVSEIIGRNDEELFGAELTAKYYAGDIKALEQGIYIIEEETVINGEKVYWRTTKSIIETFGGRKLLVALGVNLTEVHKKNFELKKAKEKAEQSDKLKSAFLANMSHEIRTPLNSIVGFSELLISTSDEQERRSYCNIIATNNDLLLRLINDILELSKIDAGAVEIHNIEFDLAVYFEEFAMTMKQRIVSSNVKFIVDNPYKHCIVNLDQNRMSQVLLNYMTNAIKYTVQGSITMGYEYINDGIKIYVQDTGIGIAEEKKHKVFSRFQKLDEFAQGTGLGLSICKAITELHGGRVGFESQEGVGSTFWAWKPADAKIMMKDDPEIHDAVEIAETKDAETKDAETKDAEIKNDEAKDEKHQKTIIILVAEDNDSNYILIRSILKNNFELIRATNGKEAVDCVKKEPVDCILMDINMPIMNGIRATHAIREFDKATPIIAVTANAFASDRYEAIESGCNDFIAKPVKKKELIEKIMQYIRKEE